jgi:hypothetical protein
VTIVIDRDGIQTKVGDDMVRYDEFDRSLPLPTYSSSARMKNNVQMGVYMMLTDLAEVRK